MPLAENCSFDIYGIDKYGFIYVGYYEIFMPRLGQLLLKKRYACYNSKGRQFGVARIDMDKYSSFLNMDTVVLEDGTIYPYGLL